MATAYQIRLEKRFKKGRGGGRVIVQERRLKLPTLLSNITKKRNLLKDTWGRSGEKWAREKTEKIKIKQVI